MTRVNILLLALALVSALAVVRVEYDARRAFAELDAARQHAQEMQLEHERLLLQLRALSVPGRIGALAASGLGMVPASLTRTDYVNAAPNMPALVPTRSAP